MNTFSKQFFYLLLALPLGILYFVVIITGLSLSLGLFIITLGVPIFNGVSAFSTLFAKYERALANNFLNAEIDPILGNKPSKGIWETFKIRFFDERTWMRVFYLLAKLPLGIITFTLEITVFVASIFLLVTPFLYRQFWYKYIGIGFWHITTFPQVLLSVFAGIILGGAFYFMTKALSTISAEFARSALVE